MCRGALDHERHENSAKIAKGEYPFAIFVPFATFVVQTLVATRDR